jgi:4,5-DOPA dioxygenase extradiol
MSRLPTLFVSHGSPLHALAPGAAGEVWRRIGAELPRPRAILIASAHWETPRPMLTAAARPETIHDFSGFPEPLYRLRYPAPSAPELARRAQALLAAAGLDATLDPERGLDHGAWSPLLHMYPAADIAVVQVSLQSALGAAHHLALGRALAPLAEEGVFIIGSGHMTHNLREWMEKRRSAGMSLPSLQTTPDDSSLTPVSRYVHEFRDWVDARLRACDVDALSAYRARAPHAARAHPTEEHFLPLFVALGAALVPARAERVLDIIEDGVLAMDAYLFHPAGD